MGSRVNNYHNQKGNSSISLDESIIVNYAARRMLVVDRINIPILPCFLYFPDFCHSVIFVAVCVQIIPDYTVI